jgi:hypothetical protein
MPSNLLPAPVLPSDNYSFFIYNYSLSKRPSFSLQKATFYTPKGHLLQRKRWPFGKREINGLILRVFRPLSADKPFITMADVNGITFYILLLYPLRYKIM